MDKKVIRLQMQEKRNTLTVDEQEMLSNRIAQKLFESPMYKEHFNICVYQSFRGEVLCGKIIEQALCDQKKVFIPVTNQANHTITFYQIDQQTVYKPGAYNILEPVIDDQSVRLQESALVLMPGLAFDQEKHRIGYGGGYYDRYLEDHKEHTLVALCYQFQIVTDSLPYEAHDILPDYIVTECGII